MTLWRTLHKHRIDFVLLIYLPDRTYSESKSTRCMKFNVTLNVAEHVLANIASQTIWDTIECFFSNSLIAPSLIFTFETVTLFALETKFDRKSHEISWIFHVSHTMHVPVFLAVKLQHQMKPADARENG